MFLDVPHDDTPHTESGLILDEHLSQDSCIVTNSRQVGRVVNRIE